MFIVTLFTKLLLKNTTTSSLYHCSSKFYLNRSLILKASVNAIKSTTPQLQPIKYYTQQSSEDIGEKSRIFTIPNYLTVGRIAMTPFISYLMLTQSYSLATGLFFLVGFTDFLDGYIARNFKNQKSYLGSILDPVADKLFIGVMTVTLGVCNLMPLEVMFIILARDLALILSAIIIRFKLIEKPRTIGKFFNIKQHSSVKIEASTISKLNTFLQICLIGSTIPSELLGYNTSVYLKSLQYLTASTTVVSGLQYLLSKGSYKVIK